jgi:CBS domain containing-hemolysin-like protein
MPHLQDVLEIVIAVLLVLLNGFFVGAEFALVKVRDSRIRELVVQRRPFAKTALWLSERLESSLSACQLGITMASLGLGWVGEPAFARLLDPVFRRLGIASEAAIHSVSFLIAFTFITSLHLVIGEQAPKIFAIRRAEAMLLRCAPPLKWFCLLTYPLMAALNAATSLVLKIMGLRTGADLEAPHSEQEIRALLHDAHTRGSLTRSEHRLLNAVFEFDDMICRNIMLPRSDVEFFDVNDSVAECVALARRTKHTRYPVCDGSLDEVLGVVHVKDLVGVNVTESFDWKSIMRPPRKVPESLPISKLLRHFQASHQLLAFVIDEYGTVIGVVTLENVLEQIIGDVEDEFDTEQTNIVPDGPDEWIVLGSTPVDDVERRLGIPYGEAEADTFSGLLMHYAEHILAPGDRIELSGFAAEVLEVRDDRAYRVRVSRLDQELPPEHAAGDE